MRVLLVSCALTALTLVACSDDGADTTDPDAGLIDVDTADTVAPGDLVSFRVTDPEFGDAPLAGVEIYLVPIPELRTEQRRADLRAWCVGGTRRTSNANSSGSAGAPGA